MANLRRLGTEAEDRAATYLIEQGYTLITRRLKVPGGELDLVALDGETLVFVEVKWRRDPTAEPEFALTSRKRARLIQAARVFLARYEGPDREVRFDVIAMAGTEIRHLQGAFTAED